MFGDDLTLTILREIRDGIGATNTRLDETKAELANGRTELKTELASVRTELMVVGETLKDLAAQMLMLTRFVKNVVDRHEQTIDDLRERMVRVETKLSGS